MKKTLITTLTLYTTVCFSQVTIESCYESARYYGDATQAITPPLECYELSKQQLNYINSDASSDYSVIAGHNMVYVENLSTQKTNLLAGSKTMLNNALATELSVDEDRVYVLNAQEDSREVLSYPISFGGNLAPRRKLLSQQLDFASNISINYEQKELYVISEQQGWIKVFNLHADPDGKRPEHSTRMKREIFEVQSEQLNPIDIATSETEMFVLSNDKILIFPQSSSGSVELSRVIAGENTQILSAKRIRYNRQEQTITVTNLDGLELVFPSNSNGNVSPQY